MGMFDDIPMDEKGDARSQIGKPEELSFGEKLMSGVSLPSWMDNLRGRLPFRAMQGMADPVVGAVQTVANLAPDSTGIPQWVNKGVKDEEAKYQGARQALAEPTLSSLITGKKDPGTDYARMVGNVLSPVNLVIGARVADAATTGARVLQGAGMGAASGAMAPVDDTSNGFWGKKAAEIGVGAVTGGVLTPVLGKVAEIAMRRLGVGVNPNIRASTHDVDNAVVDALKETGQSVADVPADQLQALREQVGASLAKGQTFDAKAALRKSDFQSLGIEPTLGQITRDPMQYAREMNLRGVDGVGEPLMARFAEQGGQLQSALPAGGGKSGYQAGTQLSESLASVDNTLRKHVSGLYGEARASAGKDLDIPLQGLAQDYADILHRYGDKVPSGVKNVLGDYGLGGAQQTKVFNFEEADKVLKAINANRSNDPATNAALSELRGSLRRTLESVDTSGGPFTPAVKAAADRFKLHDAIPALKAAAEGSVAPDDFVNRFDINGKTNEVKGLAQVLKVADANAYQEARAQLADQLRRAAFGEVNTATGDAAFSPARYMATIRRLGPDKLGAFFSPQEVQDIMAVGRVGAYMHAAPTKSPVSSSNSNAGVVNVLTKLPGLRQAAAVADHVVRPIQNRSAVNNALAGSVPVSQAPLNDAQRNYLAYLLAMGGAGGGFAASRAVGQ